MKTYTDLEAEKGWLTIAKENDNKLAIQILENLFPKLKESDDDRIREELLDYLKRFIPHTDDDLVKKSKLWIAWLEKQGRQDNVWHVEDEHNLKAALGYIEDEFLRRWFKDIVYAKFEKQVNIPHFTYDDILALQCAMKNTEKADNELYEQLKSLHDRLHDAYLLEKQDKQKSTCSEDDEKIRKKIIQYLKKTAPGMGENIEKMLDWLEKQGKNKEIDYDEELKKCKDNPLYFFDKYVKIKFKEQDEKKSTDNVEPKFKIGDWIVYNRNDSSRETIQVYDIRDGRYYFTDNIHFSWSIKECDEKSHLWTIQDAKDGDVLANTGGCILIANDNESCLCYLDKNEKFHAHNNKWFFENFTDNVLMPATKEQRDLLFQKMKEAGYEWDAKKKELKKIEQNPSWSEEDEKMRLDTIKAFQLAYPYATEEENPRKRNIDWLKSINPQHRWKPSD